MPLPTTQQLASRNERKPLWPIASLCVLTGLNLLDYLDRYILASVLPLVKRDLGLNYQDGLTLSTAFMLGYFVTSPIFGYLGDRVPRRWLIAAGVFVWSLGTLLSGRANIFWVMLLFRALVGLGEASFGTISPSWIADLFPHGKRNNAITIFYFAIPVGSALGYGFGGWIAAIAGWRAAFSYAGAAGLFLAASLFFLREPPRGACEAGGAPEGAQPIGWRAYLELAKFPRYLLVVAGYTAQTFAMGGFSQAGPLFLGDVYHLKVEEAGTFFGLSLAATGLVATLAGGFSATRWQKRTGAGYAWVLALSALMALPVSFAAFSSHSLRLTEVFLVLSMFLLFLSTGPVNTLILETVPVTMRATSMAASIFVIHLFGDMWSPLLIGHLADKWNGDLRRAMLVALPGALVVSAFFWCWLVARTRGEIARVNATASPHAVSP